MSSKRLQSQKMRGNFGFVELEEGWQILEMAFTKASKILEGYIDVRFTPEEYMNYYEYA